MFRQRGWVLEIGIKCWQSATTPDQGCVWEKEPEISSEHLTAAEEAGKL